jgi:DNA-binding CsgD family transcriptional regulator
MQDAAVEPSGSDRVAAGDSSFARGEWEPARAAFAEALSVDETAEAHDGLGRALWWLGDPDGAIEHRERAFVLLKERGERRTAAGLAVWLAREHRSVYDNDAVANGWLARAERLLQGDSTSVERGWFFLARARNAAAADDRRQHADAALSIATETGNADLEVGALAELGLAAIEDGQVEFGLDQLDEAMAAATSGEADMPETIAEACCTLVAACELAGDAGRLGQWARIVETLVKRRADFPSLAFCRTCNAEMLAATGHRSEAEGELLASTGQLRTTGHRSRCVDPAVKLAEVRIRQGRLEEAEALLHGREASPEATQPLAELSLAKGQPSVASAVLLRRLNRVGRDGLLAGSLLSTLVRAQLAQGDLAAANASAEELGALAADSGHPMMSAYAGLATGRVAAARGDRPDAHLERSIERFSALGMPFEAAHARLELAFAIRDRPEVAAEEAVRALAGFEQAGAERDADRAAALVRELGGPARTGPRSVGLLTKREREVLRLLGEGLTNADIATRLFISRKTAEHHVGNVLGKLHLRSRAEAAAFAQRHGVNIADIGSSTK